MRATALALTAAMWAGGACAQPHDMSKMPGMGALPRSTARA
jgi:hypothetical protein